jgi:hypothetical protein
MMGSVGELSEPPLQSVSESGEPNGVERAHLRSRTLGFMNRREFLTVAAAIGAHGAWGFRSPRPSRSAWQERCDLYPEGVASGDPGPLQMAEALTHLAFPAHFRVELAWPSSSARSCCDRPSVSERFARRCSISNGRAASRSAAAQEEEPKMQLRDRTSSPLASLRDVAPTVDRKREKKGRTMTGHRLV